MVPTREEFSQMLDDLYIHEFSQLPDIKHLSKVSKHENLKYYDRLLNDDINIHTINDLNQNFDDECDDFPCSGCKRFLSKWFFDVWDADSDTFCEDCFKTFPNQSEFIKSPMRSTGDFGPILDWIPIYKCDDYFTDCILMNINKKSPSYKKIAMSTGDTSMFYGYFTINKSLNQLEAIFNMIDIQSIHPDMCLTSDIDREIIAYVMNYILDLETYYA